jgi:exoribonuclease II
MALYSRRQVFKSIAVAIDASGSHEIDDALAIESMPDGSEWLCVHVADVDRFVACHSWLDQFASLRGYSGYLPDRAITMLPNKEFYLKDHDVLSLLRKQPKVPLVKTKLLDIAGLSSARSNYCLTFMVQIDAESGLLGDRHQIRPSIVSNVHTLTYHDANRLLRGDVLPRREAYSTNLSTLLKRLLSFARDRKNFRFVSGAWDPSAKNASDFLNSGGGEARLLVEELMVVAGIVGAEYGRRHRLPMPYRTQQQLQHSRNRGDSQAPIRPAAYALSPSNHVTMGIAAYARVTSPLRRYADLLCHRQIKYHLMGIPLPHSIAEIVQAITHLERRYLVCHTGALLYSLHALRCSMLSCSYRTSVSRVSMQ